MNYPKVIFISTKKRHIHIQNILNWTANHPAILKNFKNINLNELSTEIDSIVQSFTPLWESAETKIFSEIERFSGFSWKTEDPNIYVYPIPFFNSFSHPLFLKVCDVKDGKIIPRSNGLILGLLIHELCHNNFFNINADRSINESLINFIVSKILEPVNPGYLQEFLEFYKKIDGTSIDFTSVPEEIKTGEKTVREYYTK